MSHDGPKWIRRDLRNPRYSTKGVLRYLPMRLIRLLIRPPLVDLAHNKHLDFRGLSPDEKFTP